MSIPPQIQPTLQQGSREIVYLPTPTAYNQWAKQYDTDLNPLLSLSLTYLTHYALPYLKSRLQSQPFTALDIGCGTGLGIDLLIKHLSPPLTSITGIDGSSGMLEKARLRFPLGGGESSAEVNLVEYLLPTTPSSANSSPPPPGEILTHAPYTLITTTLLLEHIQSLESFFSFITKNVLLAKDGYLVVTNMHEEMGRISRAGFNMEDGTKVRPVDLYNHSVGAIVDAARAAGFELVYGDGEGEGMAEVGVEERDVEKVGVRSKKWVGVKMLVGGVFRFRGCSKVREGGLQRNEAEGI